MSCLTCRISSKKQHAQTQRVTLVVRRRACGSSEPPGLSGGRQSCAEPHAHAAGPCAQERGPSTSHRGTRRPRRGSVGGDTCARTHERTPHTPGGLAAASGEGAWGSGGGANQAPSRMAGAAPCPGTQRARLQAVVQNRPRNRYVVAQVFGLGKATRSTPRAPRETNK